jgi:predicted transcriptional regulator
MGKRKVFLRALISGWLGCAALIAPPAGANETPGQLTGSLQPAPPPAGGLQPAGPLLEARLQNLGDQVVSLRTLMGTGRVVVLLHQDRHSAEQNAAFKEALGRLASRYADRLQLVALADVGGYDFWPAKGYVKDALRPLSAEGGVTVLCDWKGAVRKAYGLSPKQSAVFVIARGELRHLSRGTLKGNEAEALLSSIEQLVRD